MAEHSLLGASGAHRWLHCPASIQYTKDMPDRSSADAEQGTRVHELCAWMLKQYLDSHHCINHQQIEKPDFEFDQDSIDCATEYVYFIAQQIQNHDTVLIEQRVDFSESIGVPDSFGTADCIIIGNGRIHIVDYKNGVGVKVDANDNPQMKLYAIGALNELGDIYDDIQTVSMTIIQPHIHNISTHADIPVEQLKADIEQNFKPQAIKANSGSDEFCAGDWCRFCKGRTTCRCHAQQFEIFNESFNKSAESLTDDEITEVLTKIDALISWGKEIKEFAVECAQRGHQWNGFHLASKSTRKFTSETAVAEALKQGGIEPYEHIEKLKTLTALEKEFGKKTINDLIGNLIEKVAGKETLVADSQ